MPALAECRVQGSVVMDAQIAPEPEQAGIKVEGHDGRKIGLCPLILPPLT